MEGQTVTTPNPYVPEPNASPMMPPQQPVSQLQGGVAPQGTPHQGMQQYWAAQPAAQGYPQTGYVGYGYGPVAPVKPRKSFKLAGALCAVGMLLALSPFIAWTVIDLVPGNHGDGGDGMYWLAVGMMFYILPIGLILIVAAIIAAIIVAVTNSSAKG